MTHKGPSANQAALSEPAGGTLGPASAQEVPLHHLIYRDGFFYCSCGKFHSVRDVDDARDAQGAHEAKLSSEAQGRENEPPQLAAIRARHSLATPGPAEWIGPALENRTGMTVIDAEVECGSYCYGGRTVLGISPEDRAFTENAHVDMRVILAGLDAVVALHAPRALHVGGVARRVCGECSRESASRSGVMWPCRTYSSLAGVLESELDDALREGTAD